jgi:hypothetical protein
MGILTPTYLVDLETRMQIITENEYARLNDSRNLWWRLITRTRTTQARKDIVTWLLNTAQIRDQGKGGNIRFDDMVSNYTTIEHGFSGAGLKMRKADLDDLDGGGVDAASQWSSDIAAQMAYWPQRQAADFLKTAHTSKYKTYDGLPFFATNHPVNPYRPTAATYANLFTGGASGVYPGALPIDASVSLETAANNLQALYAYISGLVMPDLVTPRFLNPIGMLVAPNLMYRASAITKAKFIATSTSNGGAAPSDVEGLIQDLGFAPPIKAPELANFEGGTTYFVICEQLAASQLGALIYTQREAYRVNYYGEVTDAVLNRADELEWHCKGRNGMSAGHPYLLFKVKGS